jgi:hypothetical protein
MASFYKLLFDGCSDEKALEGWHISFPCVMTKTDTLIKEKTTSVKCS